MEGFSSLQDLCIRKVATRMWHKNDITFLMSVPDMRIDEVAEEISKKNVIRLGILGPVQDDLQNRVKLTGLHIVYWHGQNERFLMKMLPPKWPAEYYLTSTGTIDKKKTVELIVKDERFDLEKRFQIACIYGFKEIVYDLWKQNPQLSTVLDFDGNLIPALKYERVITYWTQILQLEGVETKTTIQENKLKRLTSTVQKLYNMPEYNDHLYYKNCSNEC